MPKRSSPAPTTQIITKPDQTTALRVQRARLEVTGGPDEGKQLPISHPGVLVGGAPDCDLVLSDPAVSRRQFEIIVTDGGFLLRDQQSKNGTKIGTLHIDRVMLNQPEEIKVGQSTIQFLPLEEHDEFPLSPRTSFGQVLGRSLAMRRVFAVLERVAAEETTILLEGESGTGKDLAAEMLHEASHRRKGPFVVVDCGTIQSTLVESELFGHCKGAFTGANQDRSGAFETGDGGTVFLDEIGELDASTQPKLLRLLERREIKRLGESQYRPVDVRLIAATNRDLRAEVKEGRFRQDLFFRLSVVRLCLPPLRERGEDIAMLARSFVQKLRPEVDPREIVTDQVLGMLMKYDWPGNVRELRNVVERLLLFPDRPEVALPPPEQGAAPDQDRDLLSMPFHDARNLWNDRFEKTYLTSMLDNSEGVVARAAKSAGIPRQTFYRLMTKHGLTKS